MQACGIGNTVTKYAEDLYTHTLKSVLMSVKILQVACCLHACRRYSLAYHPDKVPREQKDLVERVFRLARAAADEVK